MPPANQVVLTDNIPKGTNYVPDSIMSNVLFTGTPGTPITLQNPITPGDTVTLSLQVKVVTMPNPNPIPNNVVAAYLYTIDPADPNSESGTNTSNTVKTPVRQNNFSTQVQDIIESVALEQAALSVILQAEAGKIQLAAGMDNITPEELNCINKSVENMTDTITILESMLKQKLNIIKCQYDPDCQ